MTMATIHTHKNNARKALYNYRPLIITNPDKGYQFKKGKKKVTSDNWNNKLIVYIWQYIYTNIANAFDDLHYDNQ